MSIRQVVAQSALVAIAVYVCAVYIMVTTIAVMLPEYGEVPIGEDFYAGLAGVFSWQMQELTIGLALLFGCSYLVASLLPHLFSAIGYDFKLFVSNLRLRRISHSS